MKLKDLETVNRLAKQREGLTNLVKNISQVDPGKKILTIFPLGSIGKPEKETTLPIVINLTSAIEKELDAQIHSIDLQLDNLGVDLKN